MLNINYVLTIFEIFLGISQSLAASGISVCQSIVVHVLCLSHYGGKLCKKMHSLIEYPYCEGLIGHTFNFVAITISS